MNKQKARNTAAGMVRDALERLTKWEWVQNLRHATNTKEEANRLLDFADAALSYFENCYDFPQEEAHKKLADIRRELQDEDNCAEAMLAEVSEIAFDGVDEEAV